MALTRGLTCVICGARCDAPLYRHEGTSISSTARLIATPTVVFACRTCAHIQTLPVQDIDAYYDTDYNVHLESEMSDDLYGSLHGTPVYRAEHQAKVTLAKVDFADGSRVLDYGCSKGATLRALANLRPDLVLSAFDVSDNYRQYWNEFIPAQNQASHEVPSSWHASFDAVLTFFALEHVAEPRAFLRKIRELLKPGGTLHIVIPNVARNVGDFIVVDHVNHFVPSSLRYALVAEGFGEIRIDSDAHTAAFVIDAKVCAENLLETQLIKNEVAKCVEEAEHMARYWQGAAAKIQQFECDGAAGRRSAIYGSAFYGVFIVSQLQSYSVAYFLDESVHQQAKRVCGLPVFPPEAIEDDIAVVYAGLNPARARDIIASVPVLHRRTRDFYFL